jgi:hypothetical protein
MLLMTEGIVPTPARGRMAAHQPKPRT